MIFCQIAECNSQSKVIKLLEEYQNLRISYLILLKSDLIYDFLCQITECNRQSEVIKLLEEYQNSSSTGSEEPYYDDFDGTEEANCTCESARTHEHQVCMMRF